MPFEFTKLDIEDVIRIEPRRFDDERGFFMETYQKTAFQEAGITEDFVQDNFSHSTRHTLRGLHLQLPPKAQGKLVSVLAGEVFDVAVDARKGSLTYGKWVAETLSRENRLMLYIPPGFLHGFCVLSEEADFVYKVTADYAPDLDRGVIWNDPDIGIEWPVSDPVLSEKDARLPTLKDSSVAALKGRR